MFRIDCIPHHPSIPTRPPLHACLSTSTQEETSLDKSFLLLTIGRKNCEVTFETDKCVSRRHCQLRLISEGTTPEEQDECNKAENGFIVTLTDLGSKFGTFLFLPKEKDEESDDETDDGHVSATPEAASGSDFVQTKIQPDTSIILTSLSQPFFHHQETSTDKNNDKATTTGTILLQLGVSGSQIRITRIPLRFCFSRIPTAIQSKLTPQLRQIGAIHTPYWDCQKSTHLICTQKLSTAKNISAWACHRPMVTVSFVERLLQRKHASDDLPEECDYIPPGETPMEKVDPNLDRKTLREIGVVSLVNDEIEFLVKSGGATVLESYPLNDEEFFGETSSSWLEEFRTKMKGKVVFVESSSRKTKKRREFLKRNNLQCTNQKEIAMSISQLKPLRDVNGEEIVGFEEESEREMDVEMIDEQDESLKNGNGDKVTTVETNRVSSPKELIEHQPPSPPQETSNTNDKSNDDNNSQWIEKSNNRPNSSKPRVTTITDLSSSPQNHPTNEKSSNDEQKQQSSHTSKSRKPLPKTKDGWLITAPKNKQQRQAFYHLPKPEINEPNNDIVHEAADTEIRTDLVNLTNHTRASSSSRSSSHRRNFKRFKKNSVLSNRGMASEIRFRSVLPKESARQRQLELTQQEMEREQRKADELFADDGGGMMRFLKQRKRRR